MWNNSRPVFLSGLFFLCDLAVTSSQPAPEPEELVVVAVNPVPRGGINIFVQINPQTCLPSLVGLPAAEAAQPTNIPERLHNHLNQLAVSAIDDIDDVCELTAEQKQKLLLAAKLEQQYLLRQLTRFVDAVGGKPFDQLDDTAEVVRQMREFRTAIQSGPNRGGTLLAKLLESQLSAEQRAKLVDQHIQWFLDATTRSAVLSDEQRQSLQEVLIDKAQEVGPILDRQLFLNALLHRINPQDLNTLNEPRAILAVMRFLEHHCSQP